MYCDKNTILYLLLVLYIFSGIFFFNNIKPDNEYIFLFLSFVYISYAAIFFNILKITNI